MRAPVAHAQAVARQRAPEVYFAPLGRCGGVGKRNHYSPPPPRVHTGDPDRVGRHNSRASTFPGTTNLPPVGKQSEADLPQATQRERGKARGLLPKLDTQAPQTRVLGRGGNPSIKETRSEPANQRAPDRRRSLPIGGAPREAAETMGSGRWGARRDELGGG